MLYRKIDMKFTRRTLADWVKVLVLLLDEAAVLLLVIVALRFFEIAIPLPVVIVLLLILGILVFIIHLAVISSFHKKTVTGSEAMVGTQGRVVRLLNPVGAVFVAGERWKAISVDDTIAVDENVEIVRVEGLTLRVKRADIA